MVDRLETCRVYSATIPLSFLQMSDLCTVPTRFSKCLNEKNQMFELCTFSQIRSHRAGQYYNIIVDRDIKRHNNRYRKEIFNIV